MACCLVGTNPLSEPVLEYRYLDPWELNFSEILIEMYIYSFKKMHFKMSWNWWPFYLGINVLKYYLWLAAILLRGEWVDADSLKNLKRHQFWKKYLVSWPWNKHQSWPWNGFTKTRVVDPNIQLFSWGVLWIFYCHMYVSLYIWICVYV